MRSDLMADGQHISRSMSRPVLLWGHSAGMGMGTITLGDCFQAQDEMLFYHSG